MTPLLIIAGYLVVLCIMAALDEWYDAKAGPLVILWPALLLGMLVAGPFVGMAHLGQYLAKRLRSSRLPHQEDT